MGNENAPVPAWPAHGGEMGERVRDFDWAATPLGPIANWPQNLRAIVDFVLDAPLAMNVLWGPELIQIYNQANVTLMGKKDPQGFGQPLSECWPETWHAARPLYERVFAGETIVLERSLQTLIRNGHPEDCYFDGYFTPIRDEAGVVRGAHATMFETTQRVKAEAAQRANNQRLRASEARLKAAIDLVGLSLYSWDPQTGELEWDTRLRTIWALPRDAHVDVDLFMTGVHPEERTRVADAIAKCTDPDGDGVYKIEYRVVGITNGVQRWVSTYGKTTFEDRSPVWFIGAALDITERKKTEQELRLLNEKLEQRVMDRTGDLAALNKEFIQRTAEREQSEVRLHNLQAEMFHAARLSAAGKMAAALAHELIQPLAAVRISVEAASRLLTKEQAELDVLGEVLVEAGGQVKRSAEIIHRMRDFVARGETRKQLVAVSTLIQEGKALVLPDFKSAGIDVVCHLDKEAPYVFADAIQISQVLVNLIRNAVDAMASSPRRRLTLTTLAVGPDMVAIGVGDSGPGLTEEVRDRLFNPLSPPREAEWGWDSGFRALLSKRMTGIFRVSPIRARGRCAVSRYRPTRVKAGRVFHDRDHPLRHFRSLARPRSHLHDCPSMFQ
jgi:PAS domain S-box-containing protein